MENQQVKLKTASFVKSLKNPGDVISDIQRVMPSDVKKDYRLRLTGKRDPEGDDMNLQEKNGMYISKSV